MSNKKPESSMQEDKLLTTAVGNAELFANTTSTQQLREVTRRRKNKKG